MKETSALEDGPRQKWNNRELVDRYRKKQKKTMTVTPLTLTSLLEVGLSEREINESSIQWYWIQITIFLFYTTKFSVHNACISTPQSGVVKSSTSMNIFLT